jgi:hypothetical protein
MPGYRGRVLPEWAGSDVEAERARSSITSVDSHRGAAVFVRDGHRRSGRSTRFGIFRFHDAEYGWPRPAMRP